MPPHVRGDQYYQHGWYPIAVEEVREGLVKVGRGRDRKAEDKDRLRDVDPRMESNQGVVSRNGQTDQATAKIQASGHRAFRCAKTMGVCSAKRARDSFKGEALAPPVPHQTVPAKGAVILQGKREEERRVSE